jgi:hypothetical protein
VKNPSRRTFGLMLILSGWNIAAAPEDIVVGTVKTAHAGALVRRGSDTTFLREGAHILLNDTLRTPVGGGLAAILQDGTRLSLGPNTELKIDRFVYQPVDGKFDLHLQLVRGKLAYVSGKIAQFAPGSVSVETPAGIVGAGETEFAVSIDGN